MKQLWEKIAPKNRPHVLLFVALGLSLLFWILPFGKWVVYPFSLLVTWVHEMCQGLAAEAVNFHFDRLILRPDAKASGEAFFVEITKSRFGTIVVASAGYLGSTLLGAAMLLAKTRKKEVAVLKGIVVALAFSALFFGRSFFSFTALLLLAAALALLVVKGVDPWRTFVYDLVACQVCLNALLDIRSLYSSEAGSDAVVVSKALFLPHWFWATIWLLLSLAAFGASLYIALRGSAPRLAPAARGIVETGGEKKP